MRQILKSVEKVPAVEQMRKTATEVVGTDIVKFCLDEEYVNNLVPLHYEHCLFFVAELAALEKLKAEKPGLKAESVVGSGAIGEYVALCEAGVFTVEEALKLIAQEPERKAGGMQNDGWREGERGGEPAGDQIR